MSLWRRIMTFLGIAHQGCLENTLRRECALHEEASALRESISALEHKARNSAAISAGLVHSIKGHPLASDSLANLDTLMTHMGRRDRDAATHSETDT